ncbi:hypothetical protein TYRP_013513, partial [Tyrophagus putrescentiae]
RFSLFFKKLHKLPEFWEHSGSRDLSKWVFCKSYKGAMLYQRKLLIQLNTLNATHCSSEKQFKVLLTFDGNANDDHGNEENLPKDSNGRIIFGNLEMKEGAKFSLSLPSLSVSTQSVFLLRLKPWIPLLIKTRFNFSKRLFSLLSYELGCYESDQIEEVVMPVAIEAIYLLTRVRSPAKELHCQRGSVTWKLVQSFLSQLAHLVADCLHQLKPQEWPILPLEHDKMSSVRQCLEQLMRSLFNPNGVKFLRSIYHAMHKDDGLADEHLLPFITEETVKLLKQWLSEEDTEVVKN